MFLKIYFQIDQRKIAAITYYNPYFGRWNSEPGHLCCKCQSDHVHYIPVTIYQKVNVRISSASFLDQKKING